MISMVGHNVHNVTPRLLIMVEKAQFIDIVRLLCNLGIMWDVHYHSHLREDIDHENICVDTILEMI